MNKNRRLVNDDKNIEEEKRKKKFGFRIALGSAAALIGLSFGGYKLVKHFDNDAKKAIESQTDVNTDDDGLDGFTFDLDDDNTLSDNKDDEISSSVNNNSSVSSNENDDSEDKNRETSVSTNEINENVEENDSISNEAIDVLPTLPGANNIVPSDNNPEDNKPGDNKPGDNKPGNNKPGDNKPGNNKPGNNKPGDNKPGDDNNKPGDDHKHTYVEAGVVGYKTTGTKHMKLVKKICPVDGAVEIDKVTEDHTLAKITNTNYDNIDDESHNRVDTGPCLYCDEKNANKVTEESHNKTPNMTCEKVDSSGHKWTGVVECNDCEWTDTIPEKFENHNYEVIDTIDTSTTSPIYCDMDLKECSDCGDEIMTGKTKHEFENYGTDEEPCMVCVKCYVAKDDIPKPEPDPDHECEFELDPSKTEHIPNGDHQTHTKREIWVCPEDGKEDVRKNVEACYYAVTDTIDTSLTDPDYCNKNELTCSDCGDKTIENGELHSWQDWGGVKVCGNCYVSYDDIVQNTPSESEIQETPKVDTPATDEIIPETPEVDTPTTEENISETPEVDIPTTEETVPETPEVDIPTTEETVPETPEVDTTVNEDDAQENSATTNTDDDLLARIDDCLENFLNQMLLQEMAEEKSPKQKVLTLA